MNGRERIVAMLEDRPVDRLPQMPITMMFAADRLGVPYGQYATDHRLLVEAQIVTAEKFDFDYVSCISDPAREAADCGATVQYFDNQPPAIDENWTLLADKKMADDVSGVIGRVNTTLDETGAAAKELRAVAAQVRKSAGKLHETIEQLPATVRQANTTLDGIRKVTDNLVRVTGSMPAMLDNVNETIKSLAVLVVQTQTPLREIQKLVEGAQRHWLVREYIDADKPNGRIAPKDVVVSP